MMRIFFAVLGFIWAAALAQAQDRSADDLARRSIERRAAEAVIWGMPAVNYDLMLQQLLTKTEGWVNQVVYWSRPVDWLNQTLTPNPDAIYLMVFFDTREVGPVVIDLPPADENGSFTGNIVDIWQMPLEDAGPSGADKGKGAKYLIMPPGYTGEIPVDFIGLPSHSWGGYALIRSNLASRSEGDIARAVTYGKQLKVYPLSEAENPPPTKFTDAADVLFDSTIPYDLRFFESLDRIVQREPWLERDKAMIDPLRSLDIEKGKPFEPDEKTKAALNAGAREAHDWVDNLYETALQPYFPDTHWAVPALPALVKAASEGYADPDSYPIDARALTYSIGYIGIKHLGAGQFYLISSKDKDGKPLDGASTYRLTVPPKVPVKLYWSATAYDRATHALIRQMPVASRSSNRADLQSNPDGSVDIFFAPQAPAGKEKNWIATSPKGEFEVLFRLYAPEKALFDRRWKLPDLEKIGQ